MKDFYEITLNLTDTNTVEDEYANSGELRAALPKPRKYKTTKGVTNFLKNLPSNVYTYQFMVTSWYEDEDNLYCGVSVDEILSGDEWLTTHY